MYIYDPTEIMNRLIGSLFISTNLIITFIR